MHRIGHHQNSKPGATSGGGAGARQDVCRWTHEAPGRALVHPTTLIMLGGRLEVKGPARSDARNMINPKKLAYNDVKGQGQGQVLGQG